MFRLSGRRNSQDQWWFRVGAFRLQAHYMCVCVMSWGVKEDKTQLNKYSPEQKNVKELNQGILKEIKHIR